MEFSYALQTHQKEKDVAVSLPYSKSWTPNSAEEPVLENPLLLAER